MAEKKHFIITSFCAIILAIALTSSGSGMAQTSLDQRRLEITPTPKGLLEKVSAQTSSNIEFVTQINLPAYGIAVKGTYAYIPAGYQGLHIFDVSNQPVPREISVFVPHRIEGDTCYAEQVVVAGNYAYLTADNGSEAFIVNITNRSVPQQTGIYFALHYILGLDVVGNYLYTAEQHYRGYGHLEVISVANPTSPQSIGRYDPPGGAHGVTVLGSYAYIADGHTGNSQQNRGLRIVSVANPSYPYSVGSYQTPGIAEAVAVSGTYAYVADGGTGLRIINVSNPSIPYEVGFYDTPGYAQGVTLMGNYAYIADGDSGLHIIDVSDPSHPTEAGFYDTTGTASKVAVAGNYIYVADGSGGLVILRFAGETYSISGRVSDDNSNPITNVMISAAGAENGSSATTDASGYYTITGLVSDTYTLVPIRNGYAFSPTVHTTSVPRTKSG